MKQLDSTSEGRIAGRMTALGFIRCNAFFMQDGSKRQFFDKLKQLFHAKMDWWHVKLKVSAESKFCQLNTKTTVAAADNAMARQQAFRAMNGQTGNANLERSDQLKHQWMHSQVKQSIVQNSLTPYEQIMFFETPPTFEEMQQYTAAGLFPIALASLPAYLLHLRLRRDMPGTSYQANYTLDTGERAVFSLGKYTQSPADAYVCEFIPGHKAQWFQSK